MTPATVKDAIAEAERFIIRARKLLGTKVDTWDGKAPSVWCGDGAPIQQAATRRASLDLTRALAVMRRVSR